MIAAALSAQAPPGYRTHSDADSGLTFHYPVEFQEIPMPPTESLVKARYRRKSPPDCLKDERPTTHPSFEIFILQKEKDKGGVTSRSAAPGAESKPATQSAPASRPGPRTIREAFEEANRIEGFEEFKKRKLGGWDLKPIGIPTGPLREYALVPEKFTPSKDVKSWPVGFLWIRDEGGYYIGLLGSTKSPNEKEAQAEFRKIARSLAIRDAAAKGESERAYAGSKLPFVKFRCGVRDALPKGWKALDTENFIIVYHTDSDKLVNKIARDLEAIRPVYVDMFPPVKKIETVSIVRVCKNREEYLAYGGHPSSGGFWHPGNEELVFYDYAQTELEMDRKKGRKLTDKDSFVVLYHEAFHQYIYFAVGQIAPHDWFNEGHGDYFSGALIPQYGTRVTSIGPSRWRITRAKREIDPATVPRGAPATGPWVTMDKVAAAPRNEYYGPLQGNYYTGGWALVYFLREAPEAKKHPVWGKILANYFDKLKEVYNSDPRVKGTDASLEDRDKAGQFARDAAYKAAFGEVDFKELDAAVKGFIQKMKHPWPEDLDL
jgi:hypothetical protein